MAPVHIPFLGFLFGFFIISLLGAIVARPLVRTRPQPEHLILGATTAIAIYAFFMSVIGMAGGLRFSFGFTIGILAIVGAWYFNYMSRWDGRRIPSIDWARWRPTDTPTLILFWLLIIYQAVMFINALAPFINLDVETYHYLLIREWLQIGRITIFPENGYSYYPLSLEMAVATAFGRAGERGPEAANLCFWFMQFLLMGWLLGFCAKRDKLRAGYYLVAAVSGLFYWPVIAYSGDVDGGVALFAIAGALSYLEWLERRNKPIEETPQPKFGWLIPFRRWQQSGFTQLILAGLFLGTACASKYSAIPMAGLVGAHLVWLLIADSRHKGRTFAPFLGFLIFLLIPMIPWYGRNMLATGNPMFPFMRDIFGGPEPAFADDVSTWASWGLPQSLFYYAIYPFKLAFFYSLDGVWKWIRVPYMYMSWLFALAPIAGVFLIHRRIERIVAIWCFVFFTFVFFVMNVQTRYFLPFTILALWLVIEWLLGFASIRPASELSDGGSGKKLKTNSWAIWIVLIIVLIPFATQIDLARNHLVQRLPYLAGQLNREEYEESAWPSAAVFAKANELASEEKKVCIFSLRTYRLTVPYIFPPSDIFSSGEPSDEILRDLSMRDVGYLMIDSRVRKGAEILNWCIENSDTSRNISEFHEGEILEAMSERGISRALTREILAHRGGHRFEDAVHTVMWRIDVSEFREPQMAGVIRFLADVSELTDNGELNPIMLYGEWELYGF